MNTKFFQFLGPEKEKFKSGVTCLSLIKSGQLLVGSGDGEVALVQFFNKVEKDSKNKKGKICFEKKRFVKLRVNICILKYMDIFLIVLIFVHINLHYISLTF